MCDAIPARIYPASLMQDAFPARDEVDFNAVALKTLGGFLYEGRYEAGSGKCS